MKTIFKYAATAALTGALALAAASPGEARNGRNAAAIGFGVGAAVAGAAIASSAYNNGYYGYYGDPGYAYGPGYAYAPGYAYDDGYAYGLCLCAGAGLRLSLPATMATGGRISTAPTTSRLTRSDRLRGKS